MPDGKRLVPGQRIAPRELTTIRGTRIRIPHPEHLVHLQFRRFAGCPVCSLHLHSFVERRKELERLPLEEVIVFHSTADALRPFAGELPFAVIADPLKRLYAGFQVESARRALLSPRAWIPILRGVFRSIVELLRGREPMPPWNPGGGRFGLPADFLIAPDGTVLECKYGEHVYDQWSVDELIRLVRWESSIRDGEDCAAGEAVSR